MCHTYVGVFSTHMDFVHNGCLFLFFVSLIKVSGPHLDRQSTQPKISGTAELYIYNISHSMCLHFRRDELQSPGYVIMPNGNKIQ
jgi:hypothetical protein